MGYRILAILPSLATWRALACVAGLLVAGCITHSAKVEEKPGKAPTLNLRPESLGHSLSLSQIVTGTYGDQKRSMRFEIEIENDTLAVVALTHFGATLFILRQTGADVITETFTDELDNIDPNWMLFDLQVTYWPAERLQQALANLNMRLVDNPATNVRHLFGPRENLILEVRYLDGFLIPGNIEIDHYDRPYRVTIDTLEASEDS